MHATAAPLSGQNHGEQKIQVTVFSDRALNRDLMVDFLRSHGFPQASGREASTHPARSRVDAGPLLAFVDLSSESVDSRELLRDLRRREPGVTTIAFGTAMQLAANADQADGWLELSEPASRVTKLATLVARPRSRPLTRRTSATMQRLAHVWRALTSRQRQVLALLGCGLDNQRLAATLGLSERAVKAHVSALLARFGAESRTELALIASRARVHSNLADFPFR